MKAVMNATGVARMDVIKGPGVARDPRDPAYIESITDPDELRRLAQERHIAFHPATTVARMKRRLIEG